METNTKFFEQTESARWSTINGIPQFHAVAGTAGYYNVPSYVARRGYSIADAAKSLGLRVLTRREVGVRDDVLAEIHEAGAAGSFLCVAASVAPGADRSRPIGSTSPARTAVYRAQLAAMSDADRWMSETPRAQWSETLLPGAIGVDAALLEKLGATDADAEETATAYAETFRATVRAALDGVES